MSKSRGLHARLARPVALVLVGGALLSTLSGCVGLVAAGAVAGVVGLLAADGTFGAVNVACWTVSLPSFGGAACVSVVVAAGLSADASDAGPCVWSWLWVAACLSPTSCSVEKSGAFAASVPSGPFEAFVGSMASVGAAPV